MNKERLDIQKAMNNLKVPVLICHGSADPAVPVQKAHDLHSWKADSQLFIVDSDHVFGRKHPWEGEELPEMMQMVLGRTIGFLK